MAFQVEHEDIEVTYLAQATADLTQFEADFPVRLRQAVFGEQFQEPSHSAVVLPQLTDSFDVLDPPDAGRLLFQAKELLRENHPPDLGQGVCRLDGWTVSQGVVRMDECIVHYTTAAPQDRNAQLHKKPFPFAPIAPRLILAG